MRQGTTMCGWCLTGHHDNCRTTSTYYDKTWHCPCQCRKEN